MELQGTSAAPAAPAANAPASSVEGLRELFQELKLEEKLKEAVAWCDAQGFDSVAEVKEAEEAAALVQALQLKPGKAKLLLKKLGAAADPATPAAVAAEPSSGRNPKNPRLLDDL